MEEAIYNGKPNFWQRIPTQTVKAIVRKIYKYLNKKVTGGFSYQVIVLPYLTLAFFAILTIGVSVFILSRLASHNIIQMIVGGRDSVYLISNNVYCQMLTNR